MRLSELVIHLPMIARRLGSDPEVSGIAADSRQVRPGDLFVAIPGVSLDGHAYISDALAAGALAVVGERAPQEMPDLPWGTFAYIQVPNARQAWGWLCAAWEGLPGRRMTLIGVTGTDGKTTTVTLIHAILRAAGLNAGMVSTVAARIGEEEVDTGFHTTTPDPPALQQYLARMVQTGATHAVLEVTSHGLAQHRVAGCDFDIAVITNITHEHLDFHGSLEAYRQAKAMLFEGLSRSFRKPGVPKVAVLNRDDSSYEFLRPIPADRYITYSRSGWADVTIRGVRHEPNATHLALHLPDGQVEVMTPLIGAYNISNILAATAVAVALDISPEAIARGIAAVEGIPGRMERIDEGQDFLALVDFAHTPHALEQALRTAREMASGRVIVVFGCAGLRDRQKRTLMGRVAGALADVVILTAEDPRTEDLEAIMAVSAAAAQEAGKREGVDLFRVPDRGEAILRACQMARAGDVVIACGKGHEQSMCFGTVEYPWDDREAMRRALHGQTLDTLPTASPLSSPRAHKGY
ncbi:MAG: UDP-N-acetylmuramoyl-L-alanyl-D-glutamate--2,6-diaminopimelate ligase [Anaerolineae bacterium]|nr:UDP-N-acetylmuramoyl-L-alanyl-D-glutamate--2,6-diaminopimelate ligase [Anaerolineae bacterium]MDW8069341.1 UDP-N-acetylmuramoyl-L-alanyl-D-glutamate--2,6-diaminopimelate ligase [Anaerolineae bacterium]